MTRLQGILLKRCKYRGERSVGVMLWRATTFSLYQACKKRWLETGFWGGGFFHCFFKAGIVRLGYRTLFLFQYNNLYFTSLAMLEHGSVLGAPLAASAWASTGKWRPLPWLPGTRQPVSENPGLLHTVHRKSCHDIITPTGLSLF